MSSEAAATAAAPPSIALITCSTRKPRVGPQIVDWISELFEQWNAPEPNSSTITPTKPVLKLIDLAEWNLPMYDEPTVPQLIKDPANYGQPHTRAWSEEITKHAAYIFVTPQYNWGYPASVKNAIDYLFNEWVNRPAAIISYGGKGGFKSAGQLREVLEGGCRMRVAKTMPALAFPDKKAQFMASQGDEVPLKGAGGWWASKQDDIFTTFSELKVLMEGLEKKEE